MWLHVIDYNNQRLLAIKVGEVPENYNESEFSTKQEEYYYDTISNNLGHTNFDWISSGTKNVEILDLREESHVTETALLELPIGNKSEDCFIDAETFKVPITADVLETLEQHQNYLKCNEDALSIKLTYPIDIDDSEFRVGGSHVEVFSDSIYFGAYHKHNSDNYFESTELTLGEITKLLEDATK